MVTPAELDDGASRLVVTNVFAFGEFKEKELEWVEPGVDRVTFHYRWSGEQAGWDWAERTDSVNWPEHVAARRSPSGN